jgi:hypothetical protein
MIVLVVIPSFLPAQETCAMTEPVQTLLSRLCAAEVFARDVKMQSPDFGTSQESIAGLFLNSAQWSQDLILNSFGSAACVVGVGFHDMVNPNLTMSRFANNAKWRLCLLHPTCGHFTWSANAAPAASTQLFAPKVLTARWSGTWLRMTCWRALQISDTSPALWMRQMHPSVSRAQVGTTRA